jgi:hypothetical protein
LVKQLLSAQGCQAPLWVTVSVDATVVPLVALSVMELEFPLEQV